MKWLGGLLLVVCLSGVALADQMGVAVPTGFDLPELATDETVVLVTYECRVSEATMLGFTALTAWGKFEAPGGAYRADGEIQATLRTLILRAKENGFAKRNVVRSSKCPDT